MQPTTPTKGAISIRNVTKIYDPEGVNVMAVDDCSLEIAPGEVCMIVGPSGCGKTTLLNAIAGFHSITYGEIYLDGELLCGPNKPLATQGADRMVVFQNGALFPWKTLAENVSYGPVVQGVLEKKEANDKAVEMLAEAGLGDVSNKFPGEVSSGMARRAEIVRALINDPKVLLLDEPYRAMDALTKSIMHESLLEVYDRTSVTIFFITHDLGVIAEIADHVVVMYRGKIVEQGPILKIFDRPQHPYTKGLLACRPRLQTSSASASTGSLSVSYTHLTLPTSDLV